MGGHDRLGELLGVHTPRIGCECTQCRGATLHKRVQHRGERETLAVGTK